MLTTSRKKLVGPSSGKTIRQNRRNGPGAVDCRSFDQYLRYRLQSCEKEQEIITDLLPSGGEDDQQQRLVAVQQVIPVDARAAQPGSDNADARVEHEQPQDPGDGRGDRVREQQYRHIESGAAHDFVGHYREQQPRGQGEKRDGEAENQGDLDRGEVKRIAEECSEIIEPSEAGRQTKRVAALHRLQDRLSGRPEKEDKGNGELREKQ
jgi:hypothetical protein